MRKLIFGGILTLGGLMIANAQCKTVSTLTENFDTWKDINSCWSVQKGKAMLYASEKKIIFYSMNDPKENMYLITPKIKAGNYTLSLDVTDNGGETTLEILSIQNALNPKTFATIAKPVKIGKDKKVFNISLKKDSNLGLKVMLNGVHQAVYLDNLSLKPRK
ncbi:hypothetical protein LUD75_07985 [Epilithonimonas sp. JDS]|uniref:hypothetical protein n=1 Tax=Epilithonimonas sp. JDS TaxID=2902797 RepID=UPI001E5B25B3|nr:hypothetical protein [Epilithonimonas sp. JDS]MCD9854643.1 hypothetical protein [Epilithonimonas sp. JDS]